MEALYYGDNLRVLRDSIAKHLPVSTRCTHVKGHGGAKAAVRQVWARLAKAIEKSHTIAIDDLAGRRQAIPTFGGDGQQLDVMRPQAAIRPRNGATTAGFLVSGAGGLSRSFGGPRWW